MSGIALYVKLFHESGCRLVHKYRIYYNLIPHPALRNGVIKKLLRFVHRAMAIAQLTHLHLTIPLSGSTSEPVPSECYPVVLLSWESTISRYVVCNVQSRSVIVLGGGGGVPSLWWVGALLCF